MCGLGVPVGCRMKHAKGLFQRPIRSHWCVASGWLLAAGWSMPSQRFKGFKGLKRLEGLEGFKGLRAGKRQAWTPIRSHWCVALGCLLAAGWSMPRDCLSEAHKKPLMCGLGVPVGCKRPIRSHWCVALGCLLAAGWSMPRDCLSGP